MILFQTRSVPATGHDRQTLELLLAAVAGGDQDALGALYERTRGAVYAMALGILGDADAAQDVTQDAYVRIWEAAPDYRAQGAPMAWLLTITRNLARMHLRAQARLTQLDEPQWQALGETAADLGPFHRLLLQDALATLGEQERQIVLLHASSGLKHREIAQLLELPLPTVLSKYHRAVKKLKALLKGDDAP